MPTLRRAPLHEDVGRSGGTAVCVLNLCSIYRWVISFTSRLLHPIGKRCRYQFDRKL